MGTLNLPEYQDAKDRRFGGMSPRVEGTGPPLPFKGLRTKQPISYPAAHKYDSIKGGDLRFGAGALPIGGTPAAKCGAAGVPSAWSASRQGPACRARRLVYGLPAGRFSPASTRCPSGATTSGRCRAHRSRSLHRSIRKPAPATALAVTPLSRAPARQGWGRSGPLRCCPSPLLRASKRPRGLRR